MAAAAIQEKTSERAPPGPATAGDDPLLDALALLTRLHGRPVSAAALAAGLPLVDGRMTPELFVRAAERQGYGARLVRRPLRAISNLLLPAVLLLEGGGACVLTRLERRSAEVLNPETGLARSKVSRRDLARSYSGYLLLARPLPRADERLGPEAAPLSSRAWFWGTLWRFRGYYAEAMVAAALVNVLALAISFYVMNVYDRVVPNNATATLVVLASGAAIAVGFGFLARTLRAYFLDVAGKKADVLLAGSLFERALALRLEAQPGSPGAFAAQLREFESLRDFITSATLTTVSDLPFVAFFIWVISIFAPPLHLVTLYAVPVVLAVGLLAQVPLAYLMHKHMRESNLRHGLLVESVEGMETLKTLGAEGAMQRRWEDYTALTSRTATQSRLVSTLVINFAALTQEAVTIAVVVWGVYRIGAGELSLGGLIAAVILSGRALAPLAQVANLLTRYQQARVAFRMLDGLMHQPVERPPERRFLHRERIEGRIELKELGFTYPGQKLAALDGVSARIEPGEHVAILGRIGSGKSTLLRLLLGLYRPTRGAILLDGADLEQFDPVDVRRNIGYVSQEVRLFYGTLRDNVAMGAPQADDAAVLAAARLAGLDRLVAAHPMGFDMVISERGEGLSGGQRQAVGVARALLMDPAVLLLDEPTSAMDFNSEQALIRNLAGFARGRTLLLVTHKSSMLALVERVLVLEAGKVVADGPRAEVLRALDPGAGAPSRAGGSPGPAP